MTSILIYYKWSKKYLKKRSKVIEIGSWGHFSKFQTAKYEHLGIEYLKMLLIFKKVNKVKVKNVFLTQKTIRKLRKFIKKTDLICAANVISHIPNLNVWWKIGYFDF